VVLGERQEVLELRQVELEVGVREQDPRLLRGRDP
jgi:hypothetical protein